MKRFLIPAVIFILGVLVGYLGPRPTIVRAQTKTIVHITRIATQGVFNDSIPGGTDFSESVPGEVIGFSCTPTGSIGFCYVLSR